jgi:AcrR family transcriptional regulator
MPQGAGKPFLNAASPPPKRRGGRPSLDEAGQLRDRILDAATELLLRDGYGATSIESIADRAGVSKRTFYSRFTDKPALMSAVVARIIDTQRPPADAPLIAGETLDAMLRHLAALILRAALTPQLLALHRLIVAESQRFPDLAKAVARAGGRAEAIAVISELLLHHAGAAALTKASANFAAEQFLQLIVSLPQMRALGLGTPMKPRELDAWVRRSVAIFLGGIANL